MYMLYGATFVTALIMEVPITTGNKIVYRNPEKGRVSGDRHFSKQSWHSNRLAGDGGAWTGRIAKSAE